MENFKTYIQKTNNEFASWNDDYDEWVTHSTPILFPLTHTKDGYKNYMVRFKPGVFNIPDDIELIEIEVKRV